MLNLLKSAYIISANYKYRKMGKSKILGNWGEYAQCFMLNTGKEIKLTHKAD